MHKERCCLRCMWGINFGPTGQKAQTWHWGKCWNSGFDKKFRRSPILSQIDKDIADWTHCCCCNVRLLQRTRTCICVITTDNVFSYYTAATEKFQWGPKNNDFAPRNVNEKAKIKEWICCKRWSGENMIKQQKIARILMTKQWTVVFVTKTRTVGNSRLRCPVFTDSASRCLTKQPPTGEMDCITAVFTRVFVVPKCKTHSQLLPWFSGME